MSVYLSDNFLKNYDGFVATGFSFTGKHSIIKLISNRWWKPNKTLKFSTILFKDDNNLRTHSSEYSETILTLKQYFETREHEL